MSKNENPAYSKLEIFRLITPTLGTLCLFFIYQIYLNIQEQAKHLDEIQQFITGFQKDIDFQKELNKAQDIQIQKIVDRIYYGAARKTTDADNGRTF